MELRYCEKCGDIIQDGKAAPGGRTERFVCARCRSQADGGSSRAARSGPPGERALDLDRLLDGGELDLFSNNTIEMRRAASAPEEESPLQLVDPSAPAAAPGAGASAGSAFDAPEPPLSLVEGKPGSETRRNAPTATDSLATNRLPPGARLVFPCVHCRVQLSIRPVEKISRLTCPFCAKNVYVTPQGQFLKQAPSVVLRQGSSVLHQIRPGSIVIPKDAQGKAGDSQGLSWLSTLAEDGAGGAGQATSAIVERVPDVARELESGGGGPRPSSERRGAQASASSVSKARSPGRAAGAASGPELGAGLRPGAGPKGAGPAGLEGPGFPDGGATPPLGRLDKGRESGPGRAGSSSSRRIGKYVAEGPANPPASSDPWTFERVKTGESSRRVSLLPASGGFAALPGTPAAAGGAASSLRPEPRAAGLRGVGSVEGAASVAALEDPSLGSHGSSHGSHGAAPIAGSAGARPLRRYRPEEWAARESGTVSPVRRWFTRIAGALFLSCVLTLPFLILACLHQLAVDREQTRLKTGKAPAAVFRSAGQIAHRGIDRLLGKIPSAAK